MIVRKNLSLRTTIQRTWKRVVTLLLVSFTVYFLYSYFGNKDLAISTLPASILGVALAFLIGFRVNSAYERWWEARKIWGAVVNDSRTITRQFLTFLSLKHHQNGNPDEMRQLQKELIYRQIAFAYALKNHLRKMDVGDEIKAFLPSQELEALRNEKNVPNALLQRQAKRIQWVHEEGYIEDYRHMQLDAKLGDLCDSLGGCERIKNTIFPRQYSFYSSFFTALYSYLLPFIMVKETGILVIPSTLIIGFIFYALDTIANAIENPFENTLNDTPMSALARTIEINLRQQLGESELPPPVEPVNGFLF